MISTLQQLQTSILKIGLIRDSDEYLFQFMRAYGIPNATIARLSLGADNRQNKPIIVANQIYYIFTRQSNLYGHFSQMKQDGLERIKTRFVLITNEEYVFAYDVKTGDTLNSSKAELYKHFDFFFPLIGREHSNVLLSEAVNISVAEKFAQLYNELLLSNSKQLNIKINLDTFISRLLFCFFADSVGIISNGIMLKTLSNYSDESGRDMSELFEHIFNAISVKSRENLPTFIKGINFVDQSLFAEEIEIPNFSKTTRDLLLKISESNWAEISPDVLGALLQSIVNPDDNQIGYNFTSVSNIHKLIDPLFINELYECFEKCRNDTDACIELIHRLERIRLFDPACGTGNFLIVTYKEMKNLELLILDALGEAATPLRAIDHVNLSQCYGIDSNEFACRIARLGLFFTGCQIQLKRGRRIEHVGELIHLLENRNIVFGNATRLTWSEVCPKENSEVYIIGNPSYRGSRKRSDSERSDFAYVFRDYPRVNDLDYAACWFLLATQYIHKSTAAFAFVTTNSLTQGQQVGLLWPILFSLDVHIAFAHTAFKWKNDARRNTAVTVVIVGVRQDSESDYRTIFTSLSASETSWINPYLTSGKAIINAERQSISRLPYMVKGNMAYGAPLIMTAREKEDLVAKYPMARRYLKQVMGSDEFIKGFERWCLWIDDSDVDDALSIPPIRARVEAVKEFRLSCIDKGANKLAERPYQFREHRLTKTYSIIVPSVSSENRAYIPIGFVNKNIIVTNLAFVIYDCDPWIFGVIQSKIHNLWIKTVCGGLETRLRYSSYLGYNTFPFPNIKDDQKQAISDCVYDILAERETETGKTIAQMYKQGYMSEGLECSHTILDTVIESCYKPEPFSSDQERLDCLFQLYSAMKE